MNLLGSRHSWVLHGIHHLSAKEVFTPTPSFCKPAESPSGDLGNFLVHQAPNQSVRQLQGKPKELNKKGPTSNGLQPKSDGLPT